MSKRVEAEIQCPACGLSKQMSLYRSLWVEDPANLALVMSDTLNLFECVRCGLCEQLPFAVLCTNVKRSIAIWYEPEPDPAVDDDIRQYTAHFGSNHFFSRAERIADWEYFKRRLSELLSTGHHGERNRTIHATRPSAAEGALRSTVGPQRSHTADAVPQTTKVLPITRAQRADLLVNWLEKNSSPDAVKQVVKETGYNDSPFFGAEKKRVRIVAEVAIVNTALVIFAVNQVFAFEDARGLINVFLGRARDRVFQFIETKDSGFSRRYEQRMAEYFQVLSEDKPGLGISFCFLKNLDFDPIKKMQAQVLLAARLGKALGETIDMLKVVPSRSTPSNAPVAQPTEKKIWGNAAGAPTAASGSTEHQTIIERRVRERLAEAQRGFDYQFRVRQGTHKNFLVGQGVLAPSRALTRSDDWYTCLSVYAATLLAVTEARLQLSSTVLDRYRTEVIERMVSAERNATQGAHQESRVAATADVEEVAKAVKASCARKGSYVLEPIAHWLATRLSAGRDPSVEKPIAGLLGIEATACRDELAPAMIKEFDV